jgi:hypothetical protein
MDIERVEVVRQIESTHGESHSILLRHLEIARNSSIERKELRKAVGIGGPTKFCSSSVTENGNPLRYSTSGKSLSFHGG